MKPSRRHSIGTVRAFHRALVRAAIAAGLVLASSATAAQGVVTLYGGARAGGEFIDENAGDTVSSSTAAPPAR